MRFAKHVLLLIVLTGISLLLLFGAYDEAKREAIERLNTQQAILAQQAAEGIETLFTSYQDILASLARDRHIADFDEDGRDLLRAFTSVHGDKILSLARMDASGRLIFVSPQEQSSGRDISAQPHVALMLKTHQPVVSEVFTSVQGPTGVVLHVPVLKAGRFDGSLALLFPFERICRQYVSQISVRRTGYAFILSRDGVELYSPAPGHAGRTLVENSHESASARDLARRMMAGEQGSATYLSNVVQDPPGAGLRKQAVFRPVHLLNTWWSICVTTPEEEALSFMSGFRDRWFMMLLALVLASAVAAFSLFRVYLGQREEARRQVIEEALREREVLLGSLLKNLPVDFWARDAQLNCIMQSDISRQLWGDLRQTAFNSQDQDPETLGKWAENNRRVLAGETLREEVEMTLPSGERRSFHNIVAPIRDQGVITGILGVNVDLTQRKLTEERIRASLQEKEILLKEVHHRVKNNLQIVSSLLGLQASQVRDPAALALFMETRGRVMSMSLVHEELYRSGSQARIDFGHYARSLGDKLLFALNRDRSLTLEVAAQGIELPIDAAVPCGLILNELLTNVLKHAFAGREEGRIQVGMVRQGDILVLTVEDNGTGLSENLDLPETETLGLQLVQSLVEQLHGTLAVRRSPGTRFAISFPLP